MKTRKILDIKENGMHIICIKTEDKYNSYRVYSLYWKDGSEHRKLLNKFGDFDSVIFFVGYTMSEPFKKMLESK